MKGWTKRRDHERLIGVLDIGSTKIMCHIATVSGPAGSQSQVVQTLGVGVQKSVGITSGVVTDTDAAEGAIRLAVATAERAAGVTLSDVMVSISCGRLHSSAFAAKGDIGPRGVTESDIARVFAGARAYAEREGRALVHMNRTRFVLDGVPAGDNPRGLAAARLTAEVHAVTADERALRNLVHVVDRCHLLVAGLVATPYASALAVTDEDERRLGVTVIDMGGGTTSFAAFREGQFVHCQVIPSGGHHLTFDIAQNLHAPLAEAERIKSLYASMVNAPSDVGDRFSYTVAGETDGVMAETTRAKLASVIRPRVEKLLQDIAVRLEAAGCGTGSVVVTGGASQLVGVAEFASVVMGRHVRRGQPRAGLGVSAAADGPGSAAAVGLVLAAPDDRQWSAEVHGEAGYLQRVGRWIGRSF